MNTRISVFVGLMVLFAAGSAAAAAADPPLVVCDLPVPANLVTAGTNTATGHYFEVYKKPSTDSLTWDAAKASLGTRRCGGVTGHLATITSSDEDEFVDALRQTAVVALGGLGQVWVGGSQGSGSAQPGDGWYWENNEGPFPGVNSATGYAHWNAAEPNDGGDFIEDGQENHLTLGRYGLGGGWNDEGTALNSIGGYIVEYDVPRPAACVGTSCQTIQGQFLSIPPEWIDNPGDTIKFTAYEFTDPRVGATLQGERCGEKGLTLFGAAYGKPELRIPPYLCGSPKLVVVAVDGSDLNITKGTVLIENKTEVVLPGNVPYVCKDTNGPIPPTPGEDPQYQDVVVYQTTDPGRMLENDFSARPGQDPQFAGAAGEFTNACGSSRGSGKETSYFVVGMHVDFGPGYDAAHNAAGNHDRFVALTRYKLSLLRHSIVAARLAGALKPVGSVAMEALIVVATYRLDHGDPAGALIQVKQFLKLVGAAKYSPATDNNNYNGEHLMRGTNIDFTLRVKVIPNAP